MIPARCYCWNVLLSVKRDIDLNQPIRFHCCPLILSSPHTVGNLWCEFYFRSLVSVGTEYAISSSVSTKTQCQTSHTCQFGNMFPHDTQQVIAQSVGGLMWCKDVREVVRVGSISWCTRVDISILLLFICDLIVGTEIWMISILTECLALLTTVIFD